MRKIILSLSLSVLLPGIAIAGTLDAVIERGTLRCGVHPNLPGFSIEESEGRWVGFDIDLCRAVSAAVFGDADKVIYVPLSARERFAALTDDKVDLLSRTTTWTYSRDSSLGVNFAAINFYDGQGFMVPKASGINSLQDLNGAAICFETGTTTAVRLAEYFKHNGLSFESVPVGSATKAHQNYLLKRCDAYTGDSSALAARRSTFADPTAHIILSKIISKEPLGPVVRHDDDQWLDIVKWSFNVMLAAEEMKISSVNLDQRGTNAKDPLAQGILGTSDRNLGRMLGLDKKWAYEIISQVGNYSESFERNLGQKTPLKLKRGLNALWNEGGIQYALPFK
ncbi:MAG: amino acid ABC transporter substrate-binding protein [Oceanospirillaceae bacterium]|nr:amino acid ABC transporter substrate-binding protein [Oceanospirillaceae bacterium]